MKYWQVHYKFELMEETLYLTVNLIDRFLALQPLVRKKLQLVGVTAMLLACKYEEVTVPVVEDLILISDKAYTRQEVLDMVSIYLSASVLYKIRLNLFQSFKEYVEVSYPIMTFAGEINGEHLTVQFLCSNSICVYEEVS